VASLQSLRSRQHAEFVSGPDALGDSAEDTSVLGFRTLAQVFAVGQNGRNV